jgi:hypothetical protein
MGFGAFNRGARMKGPLKLMPECALPCSAWVAGLLALLLMAGCSFPPLRCRPGTPESRRQNLVRFLSNRALMAYYDGREQQVTESLELSAEFTGDKRHAADFLGKARENRVRFQVYTDFPGYPAKRIQERAIARAAVYPFWGLPCDLVGAGINTLWAVHFFRDDEASGGNGAGDRTAGGSGQYIVQGGTNKPCEALAGFAMCVLLALCQGRHEVPSGPEAPFYTNDPAEDWVRSFTKVPFFAHARRIVGDERLLRNELRDFRNSPIPLEALNERMSRLNLVLDHLPPGASRSDASQALAAEKLSWEPSASAALPLQESRTPP